MALLSKETIGKTKGRRFIDVEVPEWDCTVRMAVMSVAQRKDLAEISKESPELLPWTMLCRTIVDQDMNPVFDEVDDAGLSDNWAPETANLLISKVMEVNSITVPEAQQVEEVAKK